MQDRVAIVTGSSRGIGRAIAVEFARAGADVVVTYREREGAAADVVDEIAALGRRAIAVGVDVSSRDSVGRMVEGARRAFGRIDILVNNAGTLQQKPFESLTEDDWDRTLDVNLKGAFLCSQVVLPHMVADGGGAIVNVSSSGGQLGGTLAVHYSASKAGVLSLTRSLARLGAPSVRVNCVAPGLIDTEMTAEEIASEVGRAKVQEILLRRPGLAEEVARVAVFLASDAASYVTGQTVNVNGGLYLG